MNRMKICALRCNTSQPISATGDRVFLSPHLRSDVPDREPPQILIGLTAVEESGEARSLQARWRDRAFTEIAHWPASCATPLHGLDNIPANELLGLAKLIVPFGRLQRGNLQGGQTIIVNGAGGYFASGASSHGRSACRGCGTQ
jgi:alcohol dehydrogenase